MQATPLCLNRGQIDTAELTIRCIGSNLPQKPRFFIRYQDKNRKHEQKVTKAITYSLEDLEPQFKSRKVHLRGTLLVHQVTGTAYIPNNLTMKSLSCFCNPDGCNYYKLESINYQTELCAKNSTRLNTSTVFSDSEDDIPLSTYVRDNDRDKSVPGVGGYSQHQSR
ncbi:hypothetical protein FQA39_LY01078 [Lamprigera yunnana]|nr:hypothetical protein FQA39_LY01078 [Lamprigera yunnana]